MEKKKIFVAYRVTGEDPEKLKAAIRKVCDSVSKSGCNYYSTLLDEIENPKKFEGWEKGDYLKHALVELGKMDALLLFINSENKSEGLLIEVGYALAKGKKIVLVIDRKVKDTYLREMVDKVIDYDNVDEVYAKIGKNL